MKLLVLSDIHGNWPALQAVLGAEPGWDEVAFCGDVVDYGPFPVECLRWVADHAERGVRGNHDNALGFDLDCQCMGSFREYSLATRAWHRTLLSEPDRLFLGHMPTVRSFGWEGKSFRMSHATPQGTCSSTCRLKSGENASRTWMTTLSFWDTRTSRGWPASGR
jgi:hypothetical protein